MKRILSFFLLLTITITMLAPTSIVFASSSLVNNENSKMFLIDELQYVDEYGDVITERHYSSVNPFMRGASGSGTFRNEKSTSYDVIAITYWVEGDFTWNEVNDTVTVSNVTSGHSYLGNIRISGQSTTSQNNAGFNFLFGLFRKYAFAKYSFILTNPIGMTRNLSVEVKVHNNGQ